jgi:signal transduction histidine kinase
MAEGSLPDIPTLRLRIIDSTFTVIAWVGAITGLAVGLLSPAAGLRSAFLGFLIGGLALGLRWLGRRGFARLAAWVFVALVATIFTAAAWTAGGLLAPGTHAYLLLVLLAGLLLGPKEGTITALGVVVLTFGLAFAKHTGRLPAPWVNHTIWSRWIILVSYAGLIAVFQALATRYTQQALDRAEREIATRRVAEAALQAAHDELEHRVKVRTEELARTLGVLEERSEALQAARVEAEAANAAKSRFLALVSHELRGPLTAIRGHLWLMEQTAGALLGGAAGSSLESSKRSTDRMLELVNELLDAERAEAGAFEVNLAPLDLRGVISAAAARMEGLALTLDRGLRVDLPSTPCWASGDEARLEQVCTNLLSNALRHARGEGPVRISLVADATGSTCRVANPGDAIPEALRPGLFTAFHQAKHEPGTTGLGLFVSSAILRAHGGEIGFESGPEGTVFHFHLPPLKRDPGA